ncbi:peroxiredoxin [Nitrolancea hollandica]|uniref:thioredoxin-dependent peroxiredoxin n=1 Tax=Nitrolancea hollandica Lb TaxID=1129897 RepID=I4EK72_9BACT|nr:peroxiredoxin [Nitrolancea hollandica]CCF85084.1 putative peroxiredoxin bcp [Nitrolancea hollandica Lb]
MKAADFTLPDSEGRLLSLSDYRGKWLVVYFYPKDDTPGCTKEACNFRDNRATLQEHGIAVVGISRDSVASHKAFAGKYNLNFPILSDESTETIRAYGAWGPRMRGGKETMGTLRNTYLVDPSGEIRKTYTQVDPSAHAEEILRDIQAMSA